MAHPVRRRFLTAEARVQSSRSQWPSGLRRGCAADRLLGLRVRILSGVWMCVLHSKDRKVKARAVRTRRTGEVQRPKKDLMSVHMRFVVEQWYWDIFFSKYLRFPLSVFFHQCCKVVIYMLILPGQTGEAWEPSIKQCSFRYREASNRKVPARLCRRLVMVGARLRSRASPRGICGVQSGTGTGFCTRATVFSSQDHSVGAPYSSSS